MGMNQIIPVAIFFCQVWKYHHRFFNIKTCALCTVYKYGHRLQTSTFCSKNECNIRGQNGKTALIEASANGHLQIGEILLNENALIDIADGVGVTALMKAAQNKYHQIVKLLTTNREFCTLTFTFLSSNKLTVSK
jgi:ankyrin repeat protein